ncbi:MAG: hypothetical protein WCI47_01130 [bacterium]
MQLFIGSFIVLFLISVVVVACSLGIFLKNYKLAAIFFGALPPFTSGSITPFIVVYPLIKVGNYERAKNYLDKIPEVLLIPDYIALSAWLEALKNQWDTCEVELSKFDTMIAEKSSDLRIQKLYEEASLAMHAALKDKNAEAFSASPIFIDISRIINIQLILAVSVIALFWGLFITTLIPRIIH